MINPRPVPRRSSRVLSGPAAQDLRPTGTETAAARPPLLELWQAEWCPASRRVRQRLTELGVDVLLRQVPPERAERHALRRATGATTVPVLATDGEAIVGEDAIVEYLGSLFPEPPDAAAHRARAARARARDLEGACRQLSIATP